MHINTSTSILLNCTCVKVSVFFYFYCVVLPSMRTGPDGFCGAGHLNLLAQSLRPNEVGQSRHHLSDCTHKNTHIHSALLSISVLTDKTSSSAMPFKANYLQSGEFTRVSDSSVMTDLIKELIHTLGHFI